MSKRLKLIMAAALCFGLVKMADAATSANIIVTIQPDLYYDVTITTDDANLNLGQVGLGLTTQTVRPATVTINSTEIGTDLRLDGDIVNTLGGQNWLFDPDTSDQNLDRLAAWATFTDVARGSAPAPGGDYFQGTQPGVASSDVIDDQNRYVGSSAGQGTTNLFENNADFDPIDMDGKAKDDTAALWLYFRMPSTSTDGDPQDITITLTAVQTD